MVGTCPAADKKAEQVPVTEEKGKKKSGAAVASAQADGAELAAPNRSSSRGVPLDCKKHWLMKVLKTGKREEGGRWRRTVTVRQSGGGRGAEHLLSFSFLTPQEAPAE